MSPLWVLPLIVAGIGLAIVALVARRAVAVSAGLRADAVDLGRLAVEVRAVRIEAADLRRRLVGRTER